MRGAAAWILLALIFQGCISPAVGPDACDQASAQVLVGPPTDDDLVPRATGEPSHVLVWADGDLDTSAIEPAVDVLGSLDNTTFGHVAANVEPVDDVATLDVSDLTNWACARPDAAAPELTFAPASQDDRARPGQGVHVYTAGFWTNGTLFYTNMERVQFDDGIPKPVAGEMAAWEGGDPLPVYVYDESSDEEPARYEDAGFFVTIPGFNEALKGMQVGTSRVAVLAPEDAYTRDDRRDHPLYGDTLVFYIELVRIEEVPCEVPEPVCDLPRAPDPPERLRSSVPV